MERIPGAPSQGEPAAGTAAGSARKAAWEVLRGLSVGHILISTAGKPGKPNKQGRAEISGASTSSPCTASETISDTALATVPAQPVADEKNTPALPVLVDEVCRKYSLASRDAGLVTELVYGVLRREGRLARLLAPYLRKPESLPPGMLSLVLLAAYELVFLDHIPPRATLHQTVGMARKRFGDRLGGVLNGVLRSMSRELESLQADDAAFCRGEKKEKTPQDIAAAGSLPLWVANVFIHSFGLEQGWDMALSATSLPVPSWRLNLSHVGVEGTKEHLRAQGALFLGDAGVYFSGKSPLTPEVRERLQQGEQAGLASRQGMGAIQAAEWLAREISGIPQFAEVPLAEIPLWDACCGRGGKSCALLERGINVELCSDPSRSRIAHVEGDMRRLGLNVPEIIQGTAGEATLQIKQASPERRFSLILLDVPCSGTGTLARNPDLRSRLAPERTAALVKLQAEIMEDVWPFLASGGLLAYMTCSIDSRENEAQISAFAQRHNDCSIFSQQLLLPQLAGQDILFASILRKA